MSYPGNLVYRDHSNHSLLDHLVKINHETYGHILEGQCGIREAVSQFSSMPVSLWASLFD